ncbi:MAG: FGGY-family carbohydrate kinase [Thermosynechococcaceae cyanobacterium MS004]|nr:FGGY-family carbohydrate kinase [Thermosynechococcaceae cyanobacterium MS004]
MAPDVLLTPDVCQCWLGIDFGTTGARAIAIDGAGAILHEQSLAFGDSEAARSPQVWRQVLMQLLEELPLGIRAGLVAIAIDGTSSTVLLCDRQGEPLLPPMMYSDRGNSAWVETLTAIAPPGHCVQNASSSLVKLLTLCSQPEFETARYRTRYLLHQADWLAFLLHGQLGLSDYHNSLKLGYDPATETYPPWFQHSALASLRAYLPRVVPPGTAVSPIWPDLAHRLSLPLDCTIHAGTTDSIAAFLASGVSNPGEAVTSLGSTLVLKLLSTQRVDRAEYGIYSHRLGDLWLVGGASNAGGAVLAHFFSASALIQLSQQIDPQVVSPLDYYPLLKPGERFPLNDPDLQPRLTPRPTEDREFLHGLLESLARIEAQGYHLLRNYGATPLSLVLTAGGGAKNEVWQQIRQRYLRVPVLRSPQEQAAYGTARLAQRSAMAKFNRSL